MQLILTDSQGIYCRGCASRLLRFCVQAAQYAEGLQKLIPQLGYLAKILPPAVLQWKLELLKQGNQVVKPLLPKIQQRVFLLTADNDFLIPSKQEGSRLKNLLPRCRHKVRVSVAVPCMLGLTVNWVFVLAASLVPIYGDTHERRQVSNCLVASHQSRLHSSQPIRLPIMGGSTSAQVLMCICCVPLCGQ